MTIMSKAIALRPQAQTDLDEIAQYIANHQVDAALRFIDAAERAIANLSDYPQMGRARPEIHSGLRSWPIRGFTNYIIFYDITDTTIDVVRILHGAMNLEEAFE